jgi:hypothetical protein
MQHHYLLDVKESKTPLHEKIPKESTYYKHWLSTEYMKTMREATEESKS